MKSFGLLRTNVGLTTNIKITIDSNYNLSLDSIESNERLVDTKLKKVKFNKNNFWDELVPYFFKNIPSETAFDIKYDNDNDSMSTDFSVQYDEIYQYGARNILNNKEYNEEFEYFAPLYIKYNSLPSKFIIFRVDGPGLSVVNRKNFTSEILKKLKTVKIFDLSSKTTIGQWLELNFKNNGSFPYAPLEIDFRNLEFSKWNGIDFKTGGYTSKSLFLNDFFSEEKEIYEFEKFIFDNYKNSNIVFPNILNLNFLFDDEPSTPDANRKWSINRYSGFYLDDLEKVTTMSPYITPFLRDDVEILEGNILNSPTNSDPFVEGWSTKFPIYVEYKGDYYPVTTVEEDGGIQLVQVVNGDVINEVPQRVIVTKYKIISDIDLTGQQSEINQNFGYIKDNTIYDYQNNFFEIDNFDSADVWLIEIDGIYHNVIKDEENKLKIISDYSFVFNQNDYIYKVGGVDKKVSTIVDFNNPPKVFNFYRCKFSDIKYFDTKIVDTVYSRFEYEKKDQLNNTEESKMYLVDLNDSEIPKRFDDYTINGEVVNIPVSSEYTANHETFKIESNDLSPIWRKNSNYCRWIYQNSLSANDYPYLLNNSLIFEDYNRTVNPFDPEINRPERNLDYFYTINSSTSSYEHHSLHVEGFDEFKNIDNTFRFDLSKYLNLGTYSDDYFTRFFEQSQFFESGENKINSKKYSIFNKGDISIPNQTLFRGIKFSIYDVDSLKLSINNNSIENLNLRNSNSFEDYKFSILLSDNRKDEITETCFELVVEDVIVDDFCTDDIIALSERSKSLSENCILNWDSDENTYSTNFNIFTFVGWYIKIDDVVTNYYISNYIPDGGFVEISDENGPITEELDIDFCDDFCLVKKEKRIIIPQDYIGKISVGDKVKINSNCIEGEFTVSDILNNSIGVIDTPENSDICLIITNPEFPVDLLLQLDISEVLYNGKNYYYKNELGFDFYIIWNNNRWELYIGGTFDVINGITGGQLFSYFLDDIQYPVSENWIKESELTVTAKTKFCNVEIECVEEKNCCEGTICHTDVFSVNDLDWNIIENWQMDKLYATGSIVIFDDILYVSTTETITTLPIILNNGNKVKSTPYNSINWSLYNNDIFWNPNASYTTYSLVYNNGDYYNYINQNGIDDFWKPTRVSIGATGYGLNETVLFKGEYYISLTSSNVYPPDYKRPEVTRLNNLISSESASYKNYWEVTQSNSPKWEPVPLWSENSMYMTDQLVVHNDIVWRATNSNITSDDIPGVSNKWNRRWSLVPDTNFVYQPSANSIIEMNNEYYILVQNLSNSTLSNGIVIYINKKWKNVLVNINISDDTLPNISETDRDELYKTIYKKLSAFNFIQSVNDISNKYDFIDYLTYVVIGEDGTISEYNLENNLTKIPNIIFCETPDEFGVKIDSLKKGSIPKPEKLKSYKKLNGGRISNISELNYYNNSSIGYTIENNQDEVKVFENFHGNKNFKEDVVYRFTGTYMPLFYDIELFKKDFNRSELGNYKFDTELTYFGLIKERKIRKINRKSSILKLSDVSDLKSIYPMLDEFGLTYEDEFIFKSTWDLNYHIESYKPNSETVIVEEPIITTNDSDNYGQPQVIQSQNNNQLL